MTVKKIEEIINQFIANMPEGLKQLPEESKKRLKEHLSKTLASMDIVTREEFEVQKAVLLRTREKLEALETKLNTQSDTPIE